MKKNRSNISSSGFFKKSALITALVSFSEFICSKYKESFVFKFLYANTKDEVSDSFINRKLKFKKRISIPFKRFTARTFEKSILINKIGNLTKNMPNIQTRTVGSMLFSFGLSISIIYLLGTYAINILSKDISELYLGIACAMVGGFLSIYQKKLGDTVCESKILSFLLFSVLGLKKKNFSASKNLSGHIDYGFICGFILGITTVFIPPVILVIIISFLPISYFILKTPESGVIFIILTIPFLSSVNMAVLCSYVSLCWFLKLIRGKRTLYMSSIDIMAVAFAAVILLGGIISVAPAESLREAWIFTSLMSGYFLAVNLIKTSFWLSKCIKALTFSAAISILFLILNYIELLLASKGRFLSILSNINKITLDSFGGINNLICFAVISLPFIYLGTAVSKKGDAKFVMISISALSVLTLILLNSKYVFFTVMISAMILITLFNRKFISFCLLSLGIIIPLYPLFYRFVSDKFGTFILNQYSVSEKINIMTSVDKIISDCLIGGIGFGKSAFSQVFNLYSSGSMQDVWDTSDLYSQIIVSVGFSGLAVFIVLIVIFLRHFSSNYSLNIKDEKILRYTSFAGLSSVMGATILGFGYYIWSNSKTVLLFWLAVGFTSSAIRIGTKERIEAVIPEPSVDIDLVK